MTFHFTHTSLPMRVRFGEPAFDVIEEELDHLGLREVVVLCTPGRQELGQLLADFLGPRCLAVLPEAVMHVPEDVAISVVAQIKHYGADGVVTIGGGSAIGLGKAVARDIGVPVIAIPTTYSGSEMTAVWGMTTDGHKHTGKDAKVLPKSVIYDAELTTELPIGISVTSGFNAIAHAVEALYAPDCSPIITLQATEGIRALFAALPQIASIPTDINARAEALYGAWLCGVCLGSTTMSLHHKICHALGGTLDLPHAETHTIVLPYVLAFNAPAIPAAMAALEGAIGDNPAQKLWVKAGELGAPRSLAELGMEEKDIPRIAEQVVSSSYGNPRDATASDIEAILRAAIQGTSPEAIN